MKKEIEILTLGDSYTIGESVAESDRWPVQLSKILASRGFNLSPPKIVAVTGWTTDELLAGMDTANLMQSYDLVTVLIGVNNQYRGRDTTNFKQELTSILNRAIILAGNNPKKVLVLSIPDWGVTPFAIEHDKKRIAKEIDSYNTAKQAVASSLKIKYIDITDISRKAESNAELIAADGLHPSSKMYTEWVQRILPSVLDILKNNK